MWMTYTYLALAITQQSIEVTSGKSFLYYAMGFPLVDPWGWGVTKNT
jgi:hypothetical protein